MSDSVDMIAENEGLPAGHKSGFIAVVGRPNVGKSTLMNAFLQQKIAIVTPRPQTTRIRQLGIITEPDYQIVFVDTPGLLSQPRHKLDEFMADTVAEAYQDADVVLWMVDATARPGADDRQLGEALAKLKGIPVILAINKIDALEAKQVQPQADAYTTLLPEAEWIMFSALKQLGLEELLGLLVNALPEGPRFYPADQITETYIRDIAAEMIREQIMLQMREEIPYGTAVQVTEFKRRDNGITYIKGTIFVERDSHKRILIGHKGKQLHHIGATARREIESLIDGQAYLELWVKVEPKWRQSTSALARFGYGSAKK